MSWANATVGCISGEVLLRVLAAAVDWSEVQCFVFTVFSSCAVVGIVVGFIGIGIVESAAVSAAASPVKCVHGGGLDSE